MTPYRVILYSKPGCHLCDNAKRLLMDLQQEIALTLQEIDITRDPALLQAYGERIPVVVIDDRVTLAAPIRERDVRAALNA